MNPALRNSIIIFVTGLLSTMLGYSVFYNDLNPPVILSIFITPFIFFSLPLLVSGLILIIVNLFYADTNKQRIGKYIMLSGIVMFFAGIYGFSTNGLNYLVSKIAELSFFFCLPTILTGFSLKTFSSKF